MTLGVIQKMHHLKKRAFIRHPLDMPIEVCPLKGKRRQRALTNMSLGGLAFQSTRAYETGSEVDVRVSCCSPPAEVTGRVVWCEGDHGMYEVGVAFNNPGDAYKMRMVEQACHIQQYRLDQVVEHGRYLTLDQAAHEWISRYARHFDEGSPPENDDADINHG